MESNYEEDEIVVGKRFSLQSRISAVQDCHAREIVETLPLFWNDAAERVLRDSPSYDPKGRDGCCVEKQLYRLLG